MTLTPAVRLNAFLAELKRRKVYRVTGIYLVLAVSGLEVASVLHDIGHAVSYQKHHRHTEYLIRNGDIPGLADRERDIAARIARFHRRSAPDLHHQGMEGLTSGEARSVRKLATILRVADALDRSHAQPISNLRARIGGGRVVLQLGTSGPADLEIWDVAHETSLFRRVFGVRLVMATSPVRAGARHWVQ